MTIHGIEIQCPPTHRMHQLAIAMRNGDRLARRQFALVIKYSGYYSNVPEWTLPVQGDCILERAIANRENLYDKEADRISEIKVQKFKAMVGLPPETAEYIWPEDPEESLLWNEACALCFA